MPLKLGNKKYKSFSSAVGALKRKGKSDSSAKKIVGKVYQKQEGNKKRKRKNKRS